MQELETAYKQARKAFIAAWLGENSGTETEGGGLNWCTMPNIMRFGCGFDTLLDAGLPVASDSGNKARIWDSVDKSNLVFREIEYKDRLFCSYMNSTETSFLETAKTLGYVVSETAGETQKNALHIAIMADCIIRFDSPYPKQSLGLKANRRLIDLLGKVGVKMPKSEIDYIWRPLKDDKDGKELCAEKIARKLWNGVTEEQKIRLMEEAAK